jgi:hydroxyquinol 1,2-dioxygenase
MLFMGLTMVVDYNKKSDGAFENSVLGPFYRESAPGSLGGTICRQTDNGVAARVSGRVLSIDGKPIPGGGAGRLRAAEDGSYKFWTVKPVPYPIPKDGPAGLIIDACRRHNMRAAHIYIIAEAPGYQKVITELFSAGDPYLQADAVFGVKGRLLVHYILHDSPEDAKKYGHPVPFYT